MNVMVRSDLITMKNSLGQLSLVCFGIALVIACTTSSLMAGIAAIVAMVPFMYVFSICAYDEMNGWERFRLTLPLSRRQIAFGRYAGMLVVLMACDLAAILFALVITNVANALPESIAIPSFTSSANPPEAVFGVIALVSTMILLVAALTLPLIMRFGMTKGTRFAPVVLVLLFVLAFWILGDSGVLDSALPGMRSLESLWNHEGTAVVFSGLCVGVSVVLFCLSALVSARLYEKRQF